MPEVPLHTAAREEASTMPDADLVLEGGGVKGSGLVGAVEALVNRDDPYVFHRIAGTSAGAIVASLLAAGCTLPELKKTMDELDFSLFEDVPSMFRRTKALGSIIGLVFKEGMYVGDFLHTWIADTLAQHGVRTWADLKQDDPGSSLPPERRYKLVVIVSDASRGLMLRLPWDYLELLGVDPDEQLVADAVRASASIPFFFRPMRLKTDPKVTGHTVVVCTDGGMLSNYPIDIFDRTDDAPSRWPTLGVKLSARSSQSRSPWNGAETNFSLAKSLLGTMMSAHDRIHVADPAFAARSVFVDTTGFAATDFLLKAEDKTKLYDNGHSAAIRFLSGWDWETWKKGEFSQLLAAESDASKDFPPS
jgi:NTE family protein